MRPRRALSTVVNFEINGKSDDGIMSKLSGFAFARKGLKPGDVLRKDVYMLLDGKIDLKHDVLIAGTISPEIIDASNEAALKYFMQDACVGKFYRAGYYICLPIPQHDPAMPPFAILTLNKDVCVRKTPHGAIVIDVVNDNKLGMGAARIVKNILGTVKLRGDTTQKLCFEPDREQRVVNIGTIESFEKTEKIDELKHEVKIMSACPHTAVRAPFYSNTVGGSFASVISMRNFKGHDLNKWLIEDLVKKFQDDANHTDEQKQKFTERNSTITVPAWSLDDRLEVCLLALRKLRDQFHARGVVHRDIKPENIKLNKTADGFELNIFDVNLARFSHTQDKKPCGTPCFVAPEFQDGALDEKSDVFSMAFVLGLILRDKYQLSVMSSSNPYILEERVYSDWKINFDIDDAIVGLTPQLKQELTNLLQLMTKKDKADRIDLDTAIATLENICTQRMTAKIPSKFINFVNEGVRIARQARIALLNFQKKPFNISNVTALVAELKNQIASVPDDTYATPRFIDILGVDAFRGIMLKSMLLENIDKTTKNFCDLFQKVSDFKIKLRYLFAIVGNENILTDEKAQRLRLLADKIAHLDACLDKVQHKVLTFDHVVAETKRLAKEVAKIDRALAGFDELRPTLECLMEQTHAANSKAAHRKL